ncbi:2-octaprenyl-3-methyl-6-methoxy-1,4-benzoquinol hydroxylase [Halomonas citrativorans]|uniref:2-octaprenyl-3-methyl-6-methoxy-1,4-benzoquinol hydroxylase n=1 Tax=Halomonas citrativorans TaxID=2742612 RepID=A0A1R4HV36_9GAMM|nr:UbiH/UbiF/VisC/COQ6 family ubiquinone biosynthesis hydroxylase [Halomonas citrativorans]SJN11234.1 2-octaprenyl-3-methyl-6-methoxy-1,4-benzoquinol hydroxylase [Halomonas citrativorans]
MDTHATDTAGTENFDVIVVGAGMVGTALTALLAQAGMRVALVEARHEPQCWKAVNKTLPTPRVSALTPVSQRLLTHLDVWPAMAECRVTPYRYMQVWDAEGSGEIKFSADEAGVPVLGHIVENAITQAALNDAVLDHPRVECFFGCRVQALQTSATGRWLVLDDARKLHAPLLVAADGARSTLRELADIEITSDDMGQEAVVTTVKCAHVHGSTARQAFTQSGPLAFLPITLEDDARYCSIVWSTTPEHALALSHFTPDELGKALGEAFGYRLGEVEVCDRAYRFPLVQRHARQYVLPHFALIGDAAHSIHPLAGQGVNLGLMDAAVLAEEVVSAWKRGAPWGELTTLKRYERRRRLDNSAMLGLMKGFRELFGTQMPLFTLARNLGMSGMNQLSPVKRSVMRQATGERGRLPHSCR